MFVSAKEASNEKDRAETDLRDGVHRIKKDAQETAGKVQDDLQSATATARAAGARVRDFVQDAGHSLHQTSDHLSAQIRHNPLPAAALAMGVGVILGALLSRR